METTVHQQSSSGLDIRHSYYQEIKARIHTALLNRLNLERLSQIKREDAERKRAFREYAQTEQARELLDRMNAFAGFEGRP